MAAKDGLVPLYCFYVHRDPEPWKLNWHCGSFPHSPESYGCSLVGLRHVEALQKAKEDCAFSSVMQKAIPWHCLICCSGYGGSDLPSRAWSVLQETLDVKASRLRKSQTESVQRSNAIGLRRQAPNYVLAAMEGREGDSVPSGVRHLLVVRERV